MANASYGAFQFSLKAGNDLLNIAADSAEQLFERADALFGEGAGKDLVARFFVTQAFAAPSSAGSEVLSTTASPASSATTSPQSVQGETCPECGKGQLVIKQRKDGSGTFRGCNRFREGCRYIAKGR